MASKYEIEIKADAIRAERMRNIEAIKPQISECEALLAVMPNSTLDEQQDRRIVTNQMRHLRELLSDEERAYKDAEFEAEQLLKFK